jgi:hypothetical protein
LEGLLRTHGILVEPIIPNLDGGNDGNNANAGHGGSGKEEVTSGGSPMMERGDTARPEPGPGSGPRARARAAMEVSVGMDGADVLQQQRRSEGQDQIEQDDWPNSHLVSPDPLRLRVPNPHHARDR